MFYIDLSLTILVATNTTSIALLATSIALSITSKAIIPSIKGYSITYIIVLIALRLD